MPENSRVEEITKVILDIEARGAEQASKATVKFSKALGGLEKSAKSLLGPVQKLAGLVGGGLGFGKSVGLVEDYYKAMTSLSAQMNKYNIGAKRLESTMDSLSSTLHLTKMETIGLMSEFEKGFPLASVKGLEKIMKNIKNVVGSNVDAMKSMGQNLMSLSTQYPWLQKSIENIADSTKKVSKIEQERLKINLERLMVTKQLSLSEVKLLQNFVNQNKQISKEDEAHLQNWTQFQEKMQDVRIQFEKIAMILGEAFVPMIKKISAFMTENKATILFWTKNIAKWAAYIAPVLIGFKAMRGIGGMVGAPAMMGASLFGGKKADGSTGASGIPAGSGMSAVMGEKMAGQAGKKHGKSFMKRILSDKKGNLQWGKMMGGAMAGVAGGLIGKTVGEQIALSMGAEKGGVGATIGRYAGGIGGGMMAGAAFGPAGALVGGAVGGAATLISDIMGYFNEEKREKEKRKQEAKKNRMDKARAKGDEAEILKIRHQTGEISGREFEATKNLEKLKQRESSKGAGTSFDRGLKKDKIARQKERIVLEEFIGGGGKATKAQTEFYGKDRVGGGHMTKGGKRDVKRGMDAAKQRLKHINWVERMSKKKARQRAELPAKITAAQKELDIATKLGDKERERRKNLYILTVRQEMQTEAASAQSNLIEKQVGLMLIVGNLDQQSVDTNLKKLDTQLKQEQTTLRQLKTAAEARLASAVAAKDVDDIREEKTVIAKLEAKIVDSLTTQNKLFLQNIRMHDTAKELAAGTSSIMEAQIGILDQMGMGIGAPAEMRYQLMKQIGSQILETDKQIAKAKKEYNEKGTDEALKQVNKYELERLQLVQKQFSVSKSLREGWVSALSAMTVASGRITKIMITRQSNLATSLSKGGVTSNVSGKLGAGGGTASSRFGINVAGGLGISGGGNAGFQTDFGPDMRKVRNMNENIMRGNIGGASRIATSQGNIMSNRAMSGSGTAYLKGPGVAAATAPGASGIRNIPGRNVGAGGGWSKTDKQGVTVLNVSIEVHNRAELDKALADIAKRTLPR